MIKAEQLNAAIFSRLQGITVAAGYHTDLQGVFELLPAKDTQLPPYALLRWTEDERYDKRPAQDIRRRTYVIEGVFARSVTLSQIERFRADVSKALGAAAGEFSRPIPAELISESAELSPAEDGSGKHSLLITIQADYVETYS